MFWERPPPPLCLSTFVKKARRRHINFGSLFQNVDVFRKFLVFFQPKPAAAVVHTDFRNPNPSGIFFSFSSDDFTRVLHHTRPIF